MTAVAFINAKRKHVVYKMKINKNKLEILGCLENNYEIALFKQLKP